VRNVCEVSHLYYVNDQLRVFIMAQIWHTFVTLHLEFRKQILTGNVSSPLKVGGTRLCCGRRDGSSDFSLDACRHKYRMRMDGDYYLLHKYLVKVVVF
jgi:hypothetical protein